MIKKIDGFSKNVILVFFGTSLGGFFNLIYQFLIAHRLSPVDFAAINSLLSIFMILSSTVATLQTALVKYISEFNAKDQSGKIKLLLSGLIKKSLALAIITFFVFYFSSFYLLGKLKIYSLSAGLILSALLGLSWILPIIMGGVNGLEMFKWISAVSVITGALKLILTFILIQLGFNISGALTGYFIATLISAVILYFPIKNYITFGSIQESIDFRGILLYMFPIAISSFCFINLISMDMILVKYFFTPEDSGIYSLAQMIGKICLFLPGAISIVMFPRTSHLNAKNQDTSSTLKKSLLYAGLLCLSASLLYNLLPGFILKILTGKSSLESIALGRLFSVSMSFFALLFILTTYFISVKDLRFIKYLVLFTVLQFLAIIALHGKLIQIQSILCINSALLFFIHLILAFRNKK